MDIKICQLPEKLTTNVSCQLKFWPFVSCQLTPSRPSWEFTPIFFFYKLFIATGIFRRLNFFRYQPKWIYCEFSFTPIWRPFWKRSDFGTSRDATSQVWKADLLLLLIRGKHAKLLFINENDKERKTLCCSMMSKIKKGSASVLKYERK